MRRGPVARAVRGGVSRRRVQTTVIALVLLVSTAASVLALALVVDSRSPFDHAFAVQRGADVAATVDAGKATAAELAATTRLAGVTAAAGPFPEVMINGQMTGPFGGQVKLPQLILAGRSGPGGGVDDLTLQSGHWATKPGQVVLDSSPAPGEILEPPLGQKITLTGVPGKPTLTVVGLASSVTGTAGGWATPGEIARLRAHGAPDTAQLLYRFRSAATAAAISADERAVRAALPAGTIIGAQSYLSIGAQEKSGIAPFVPFLVAFGIIGLVMSVLIVANVVSGAVVSGYRRIGILKSIGFTPGQVVSAYAGQVAIPAVTGCVLGVVLGNLLALPLLAQTANAFGVGGLGVPVWVDAAVPVGMLAVVGLAALLPSLRAGRLSAVQAIALGRAPATGRGYAAHRLLAGLRLPRPVSIGLAAPFARPARTAITLTSVLLGATAVTFAVGLSSSLSDVVTGLSHARAQPVQVNPSSQNAFSFTAGQQHAVETALSAQPGTAHYTAETDQVISVSGLPGQVPVTAYSGDSAWTGYAMISGHWFSGPGQVVVPSGFLWATGKSVGQTVTLVNGGHQETVRIVGQVFDTRHRGVELITSAQTLAGLSPGLVQPDQFDVGLRPGTSAQSYVSALTSRLGSRYLVGLTNRSSQVIDLMQGLIGTLTLLLALVAGLGVLNAIVLSTRERVHDLGVFKAVGMTPRQTIAMVVCWVAGTGLIAGLIGVPAGIALEHYVLPVMGSAANTGVPAAYLDVYHGLELVLLALSGVVIAVLGALLPAGWAARTRTATALHAE
jgi:putative ABC transport system permease protein